MLIPVRVRNPDRGCSPSNRYVKILNDLRQGFKPDGYRKPVGIELPFRYRAGIACLPAPFFDADRCFARCQVRSGKLNLSDIYNHYRQSFSMRILHQAKSHHINPIINLMTYLRTRHKTPYTLIPLYPYTLTPINLHCNFISPFGLF